jgi:aerobic-type carbon monoxide dehydrogenase small subunit (CoxS/CutS family)
MAETIRFRLNDRATEITVDPERKLLWILRTELGLTGAKYGCGEGICGACTVLIDRKPVRSCRIDASEVQDRSIITVEGLAKNGELHPLQAAFAENGALQCGYCTPGMILGAYGLLLENPEPTRSEIIDHMNGHLCRCSSYNRIVEAIEVASKNMTEASR